jgi:hypothetical protein
VGRSGRSAGPGIGPGTPLLKGPCGLTPCGGAVHNPGVDDADWRLKLDDKLHQMLRELRRALSDAISESTEVSRSLRKIREEGYSLYLLVDCKRDGSDTDALPLGHSQPRISESDPNFLINGKDLSFLKSIGIDPTRRLRRRRAHPVE